MRKSRPHKVAFTVLIFVASLVPVVGNLVSGAVLIVASYVYKGPAAVGIFLATTFILHKIEAYFLNPRLAARHVKLPALMLIISLILFEHMFGIIGLFLSFPALYVGLNVMHDLQRTMARIIPVATGANGEPAVAEAVLVVPAAAVVTTPEPVSRPAAPRGPAVSTKQRRPR